jgi:hypothetical protein
MGGVVLRIEMNQQVLMIIRENVPQVFLNAGDRDLEVSHLQ